MVSPMFTFFSLPISDHSPADNVMMKLKVSIQTCKIDIVGVYDCSSTNIGRLILYGRRGIISIHFDSETVQKARVLCCSAKDKVVIRISRTFHPCFNFVFTFSPFVRWFPLHVVAQIYLVKVKLVDTIHSQLFPCINFVFALLRSPLPF